MNSEQKKVFEAAKHGDLDKIPKEFLTQENLTIKASDGGTPFQWAAYSGALDQIPRELLTQENLTRKNGFGWTPFHFAAKNGALDQIPRELLTQENLTIKNKYGSTPLHYAAYSGDLTAGTITNLLRKFPTKESLEILIEYSDNQRDKDFLQKGLDALKKMEASRQKLSDAIAEISNPQIS